MDRPVRFLGWHIFQNDIEPKSFNSETRMVQKIRKVPRNVPEHYYALLNCLRILHQHFSIFTTADFKHKERLFPLPQICTLKILTLQLLSFCWVRKHTPLCSSEELFLAEKEIGTSGQQSFPKIFFRWRGDSPCPFSCFHADNGPAKLLRNPMANVTPFCHTSVIILKVSVEV